MRVTERTTLQTQLQETAILVQLELKMRLRELCFGVYQECVVEDDADEEQVQRHQDRCCPTSAESRPHVNLISDHDDHDLLPNLVEDCFIHPASVSLHHPGHVNRGVRPLTCCM